MRRFQSQGGGSEYGGLDFCMLEAEEIVAGNSIKLRLQMMPADNSGGNEEKEPCADGRKSNGGHNTQTEEHKRASHKAEDSVVACANPVNRRDQRVAQAARNHARRAEYDKRLEALPEKWRAWVHKQVQTVGHWRGHKFIQWSVYPKLIIQAKAFAKGEEKREKSVRNSRASLAVLEADFSQCKFASLVRSTA